MSFELPKPEKLCHHTGFEKKCRELVTSGKCERWKCLPGADPFTGNARTAWGCTDDLVLFLQGEVLRQTDGAHTAITDFREMVTNPDYRARRLKQDAEKLKQIEAKI